MFDFPASPTVGATYNVAGKSYVYDGEKWRNAPSSMPPAKTAQARNRVVNPCMAVSQENGRTTSANSINIPAYYGADQWYGRWNFASGAFRCTSSDAGGVDGLASLYLGIVTAKPSLAATGEYAFLTTRLEGLQTKDFLWGTPAAKQVVLRFSAKATALPGTYCVRIISSGTDRSFVAPFTIAAANVMQDFSIVIPGSITGTWATDTSWSLQLDFIVAASAGYQGVAGWQDGNFYTTAAQVNGASVVQNFFITNVGLYLDPDATGLPPPFQVPAYDNDLIACKRYWQRATTYFSANVTISSAYYLFYKYTVPTRASPTLSGVNAISNGGLGNVVGTLSDLGSNDGCVETRTATNTQSAVCRTDLVVNARM